MLETGRRGGPFGERVGEEKRGGKKESPRQVVKRGVSEKRRHAATNEREKNLRVRPLTVMEDVIVRKRATVSG